MTDPRITKGCELLVAYEAGCLAQIESTEDRDELEQRHDDLQEFLADNADFFLRDLPARVAELEEGLRPFATEGSKWKNAAFPHTIPPLIGHPHDVHADGDEVANLEDAEFDIADLLRAATLLEGKAVDSIPTPPEASDDQVERVARAIYEERFQGKNVMPFEAFRVDHERTYGRLEAQARAALSALRMPAPAVDEGKLREIRRRHDYCAHVATKTEWEDEHAWKAHDDRAALLAMLDGGRDG